MKDTVFIANPKTEPNLEPEANKPTTLKHLVLPTSKPQLTVFADTTGLVLAVSTESPAPLRSDAIIDQLPGPFLAIGGLNM